MAKLKLNTFYSSLDDKTEDSKCLREFLNSKNFSSENILFNLEKSFKTKLVFKEHFYKDTKKSDIIKKIDSSISRVGYIKKKKIDVKQISDEFITNCQRHGSEDYLNTIYITTNSFCAIVATLNQVDDVSDLNTQLIQNKMLSYHQQNSSNVGPINWDSSQGSNIGIDILLRKSTSFGILLIGNTVLSFSVFSVSNKNKQPDCKNISFGKVEETSS